MLKTGNSLDWLRIGTALLVGAIVPVAAAQHPQKPVNPVSFMPFGEIFEYRILVKVETPDGHDHTFLVDSGMPQSIIAPELAQQFQKKGEDHVALSLNLGVQGKLSFLGHSEVEPGIYQPTQTGKIEGAIGTDVLSSLKLRIDAASNRVWASRSTHAIPLSEAKSLLRPIASHQELVVIPLKQAEDKLWSFDAKFRNTSTRLDLDTGSNFCYLPRHLGKNVEVKKFSDSSVLRLNGLTNAMHGLAKAMSIGRIRFLWPDFYQSDDGNFDETEGFFGPFQLPHPVCIIDFLGKVLLTLTPTPDEEIDLALTSFLGGPAKIKGNTLFLLGWQLGKTSLAKVITIAGRPPTDLIHEFRLWQKGDFASWVRLLKFHDEFVKNPKVHLLTPMGIETTVQIGKSEDKTYGRLPPESGPGSVPSGPARPGHHWRWIPNVGWTEVLDNASNSH